MSNEEALAYIEKTNFCCGCSVDFGNKEPEYAEKICDECEHRRFFEFVKNMILKEKDNGSN